MIRKPPPSPDGQLGRPKPGAVVSGLRMNSVPNQRMKRMKAATRTVLIFFSDIVLLLACLRQLRLTTGRVSLRAQVRAVTSRAKAAMMTATRT
jgi:hypothetical protein